MYKSKIEEEISILNKKIYYILDENKNAIPANYWEWTKYSRENNKIIKQEHVHGKWISTVFIGLDHSWNGEKLEIFETMIFPSEENLTEIYCDRYATLDEAKKGHEKAIEWLKNEYKEDK